MGTDKIKDVAGSVLTGLWDAENAIHKAVDNPGKTAKKGAKKVAQQSKEAAQFVAKAAVGLVANVAVKPAPYLLKKAWTGVKASGKGLGQAAKAVDYHSLDMHDDSAKAQEAHALLQTKPGLQGAPAALSKLHQGFIAAMRVDAVIRANPALLRIDKSEMAKHVTASVAGKVGKLTLATALFTHVPGLQHMVIAHYLSDPTLMAHLGLSKLGAQLGAGLPAVAAAERYMPSSLEKSNALPVDIERHRRMAAQRKQISHMQTMATAIESIQSLRAAASGVPDVKVWRRDVHAVRQGLKVAEKLAAFVQSPAFAAMSQDVDLSAANAKADRIIENLGAEALPDTDLPGFAYGPGPAAAVPAKDGGTREIRLARLFTKKRDAWRDYREKRALVKKRDAAEARALKYAALRVEAQDDVDHASSGDGLEDMAAYARINEYDIRSSLAQARAGVAQARLTTKTLKAVEEDAPAWKVNREDLAKEQERVTHFESELTAQRAVLAAIPQSLDNFTGAGIRGAYEARMRIQVKAMDKRRKKLQAIDEELKALQKNDGRNLNTDDQVWRLKIKMAERRKARVESKLEIARLEHAMARLELQLGQLIREGTPESMRHEAMVNRRAFSATAADLAKSKIAYATNLAAEKRSSVWVKPNETILGDDAPPVLNGIVKLLWWSRSVFPLTAIPDWGIRHLRMTYSERAYLSYVKRMLGEKPHKG